MNTKTAEILCKLNTEFYAANSVSFAETRQTSWPGWKRGLEIIMYDYCSNLTAHSPYVAYSSCHFERSEESSLRFTYLSVFDLACGNLRFESFLERELDSTEIEVFAVDNCSDLLPLDAKSNFCNLDIVGTLLAGESIHDYVHVPLCDLSVAFGFLHHVPGMRCRKEVLKTLVKQTKPSGYVMVSLWQFSNNKELKKKALHTRAEALQQLPELDLDEGDYLLGWKKTEGVYRYCHSFSEDEIGELIDSIASKAELIAHYVSDGRGDDLNAYLIFRRNVS